MAFSLDRVLKALLFGASGPLSVKDIQRVFSKYHESMEPAEEGEEGDVEVEQLEQPFLPGDGMPTTEVPSLITSAQIRESMDRIAQDLVDSDEVYRLIERHSGFVLVTSPTVGEWIRLLRDEPRPMKLSQSAQETLAVVAYRQPVVRSEIEKIRGVSVDNALSKLLERELIQVVGRADLPGRPIQYGTTEEFLEFVGIRSIEELPASDVLAPRQIDEWLREASNQHEVTEREMGLPEGDRGAAPPPGGAVSPGAGETDPGAAIESEATSGEGRDEASEEADGAAETADNLASENTETDEDSRAESENDASSEREKEAG